MPKQVQELRTSHLPFARDKSIQADSEKRTGVAAALKYVGTSKLATYCFPELSLEVVRMQLGPNESSIYYPAARKLFEKMIVLEKERPQAN